MTVFEGKLVSENIKVGIVASRFNEFITSKLIGGAMDGLLRHNVREQDVDIAWVPGAFGSHYDLVCNEAAKGIAHVSLESGVPVMFGIVTTDTIEQAIERAGTKAGNKGFDCATSAIEMVNLLREIEG